MSQKELAFRLGIAANTFNGYETGKHDPKSDILIRIAKVCGVTTDFLLGLDNTSNQTLSNEALVVAGRYEQASDDVRSAVLAVLNIKK